MHPRNFDIILLQEPWFGPITGTGDLRGGCSHRGWTPLLPTFKTIPDDRRPRVMAYYRQSSLIEVTPRTDLLDDLDIQVIDVKRRGPDQPMTRVINIYNQADADGGSFSVDRLANLRLDPTVPTIITGDWNLHHPLYRQMSPPGRQPDERAENTVEWLTTGTFELENDWNQETWHAFGSNATSALDFTFKNAAAIATHALQGWSIESDENAGSDHYATFFSIANGDDALYDLTEAKYNWKDVDGPTFTKELQAALRDDEDRYDAVFGPLFEHPIIPITTDQLDEATELLHECMAAAANKAVPPRRPSSRSKPWWSPALTKATHERAKARKAAREELAEYGICSQVTADYAKHCAAKFDRLYKKAKRDHHNDIIESATPQNFYDLLQWTKGNRQYPSPPISRGANLPPAVTHKEKCDELRRVLLPTPPDLADFNYPDLEHRENDIPWVPVTRNEVRTAIFKQKSHNAPGISGMSGAAFKLAWQVAEEEIVQIVRLAAEIGHHPSLFHSSLVVTLRKPKKPDYSQPRAYRPIQLLEVLGKVIERIMADRLSYLATKFALLPMTLFGGVKGRSAEDAGLVAVHDTEAARNCGLVMSSLTFDITGFFDFVPHPALLTTMRDKGIPLPIIKWTTSFLSDRMTAICLDGKRDTLLATKTGIPQGSCVSPILAAYFSAPLVESITEATNLANLPAPLGEVARDAAAIPIPTILYVDDGKLRVASTNLAANAKLLAHAYDAADTWLHVRGMATDKIKRDLIHHTWRTREEVLPPVILPANDFREATTIHPSKSIKWLGITFDAKLTFHEHIKAVTTRAARALDSMSLLGNSTRGLHQYQRRLLYQGVILPMMTYASPVWWRGRKTQSAPLSSVQNKALRFIAGAFRTTPTYALEIECSIPPIHQYLDYINDRTALRFNRLDGRHPISNRLPTEHRIHPIATPPPLDPPHKKSRNWSDPARRARDRSKQLQSTTLWRIATRMAPNSEVIDATDEPPWHETLHDEIFRGRLMVKVPRNEAGESFKEEWAKTHRDTISELELDDANLLVYTDGSLSFERGIRNTGAGFVIYRGRRKLREGAVALGQHVEVFDAEMEGLAMAAEAVKELMSNNVDRDRTKSIHFFADNTGALQRIHKGTPGKAQNCSRRFRAVTLPILHNHQDIEIILSWVPGHQNIAGNERSDKLAKEGSAKQPAHPEFHSAAYAGCMRRHELRKRWIQTWIADPNQRRPSSYKIANKFPPSLMPSKWLRELTRKTFSRLIQCRTGHAHIGSYYIKFVPEEDRRCQCGEPTQTRDHILLECPMFIDERHLLGEGEDCQTRHLLGTTKGIGRLANFLEATAAFTKLSAT